MSNFVNENELKKVRGGIDKTKKYSFYMNQKFRLISDDLVSITVLENYIDVPYNTDIRVNYQDIGARKSQFEYIECWMIEKDYELE